MKRKGFTLVELLAVIIIIAVIALISAPMIIGVIDNTKKGALKDSAYGLMKSADIYYATNMLNETGEKTEFLFEDGEQITQNKLQYKGKVKDGSLRLYSDGKTALCISDGKYIALKNVNDEEVKVTTGRCSYNIETEEYETTGLCQDLQNEIEKLKNENKTKLEELEKQYKNQVEQLIKDYENQKITIENTYKEQIDALNQKISELESNHQSDLDQAKADYESQVKTQQEAYEAQINELNNQLNMFKTGGTATVAQILTGKTAYVKGQLITGSMKDYSTVIQTATTSTADKTKSTFRINGTDLQIIPAIGYWGTWSWTKSNITIPASSIGITADKIAVGQTIMGVSGNYTSDATASASNILIGKTAYANGVKVTGTMANRGTVTSTLNAGKSYTIPAGYHDGKGKVTANSLASQTSGTATASQILAGKTAWVNGEQVTGTLVSTELNIYKFFSEIGYSSDSTKVSSLTQMVALKVGETKTFSVSFRSAEVAKVGFACGAHKPAAWGKYFTEYGLGSNSEIYEASYTRTNDGSTITLKVTVEGKSIGAHVISVGWRSTSGTWNWAYIMVAVSE